METNKEDIYLHYLQRGKRKFFGEIILIFISLLIIVFGVCCDTEWLDYFMKSISNSGRLKGALETTISVQATISTLTIAFISLSSPNIEKNIYGMQLFEYYSNTKPVIFKYKNVIIVELILLILNLLLYVGDFLFAIMAVFVISVFLIIKLCIYVFSAAHDGIEIEREIAAYYYKLINETKDEKQKNAKVSDIINCNLREIEKALNEKNVLALRKELDFVFGILTLLRCDKSTYEFQTYNIRQVVKALCDSKDFDSYCVTLELLAQLYNYINSEGGFYFRIFGLVDEQISQCIAAVISYDDKRARALLYSYYCNLRYKEDNDNKINGYQFAYLCAYNIDNAYKSAIVKGDAYKKIYNTILKSFHNFYELDINHKLDSKSHLFSQYSIFTMLSLLSFQNYTIMKKETEIIEYVISILHYENDSGESPWGKWVKLYELTVYVLISFHAGQIEEGEYRQYLITILNNHRKYDSISKKTIENYIDYYEEIISVIREETNQIYFKDVFDWYLLYLIIDKATDKVDLFRKYMNVN